MPARTDRVRPKLRLVDPREQLESGGGAPAPGESESSQFERSSPKVRTLRGAESVAPASGPREREPEQPTDAELVAALRQGREEAFEVLYRRHAPYILALGVRVQGHARDVEDLVHDAFVRAREQLSSLRSDTAFRAWLSSIVVSLVRTRLRRRRLLRLLGLESDAEFDVDALASRDAGPHARAQIAEVYRVLETLPADARICWTLRHVDGRKLEEVAEITGRSLATVKRRILTAEQRLLSLRPPSDDSLDGDSLDGARRCEAQGTALLDETLLDDEAQEGEA